MSLSNPPTRFPTFRFLFSWLFLRVLIFLFVCLATLLGLFYGEENFRGKQAWKTYARRQAAKGEKLSFAEFIPPPVPAEQNLALCPLLKPILDMEFRTVTEGGITRQVVAAKLWTDTNRMNRIQRLDRTQGVDDKLRGPVSNFPLTNGWANLELWQAAFRAGTNLIGAPEGNSPARDVLWALRRVAPDLAELQQEANRRPLSRWPIFYDTNLPWGILLPHLAMGGKRIVSLLQLRATAYLAAGETDAGLADIELGVRMAESFRDEPFIISQLVRRACLDLILQPVKEGLARHQFSDAQLAELQKKLFPVDLLAGYQHSVRAERSTLAEFDRYAKELPDIWNSFDSPDSAAAAALLRFAPSGWIYQNQLQICRICDQFLLPAVDLQTRRAHPEIITSGAEAIQQMSGPFSILPKLILPAQASVARKLAYGQTQIDEAQIACALERFRLLQGSYPETLDGLAPRFIEKIPQDIISGQSLKYRRTNDGQYILYSVGWDEKDDNGLEIAAKGRASDFETGDWVWRLPAKLEPREQPKPTTDGHG